MIDDDFDDERPIIRIPKNEQAHTLLGHHILKMAEQYLESIPESEHQFLIKTLTQLANQDTYFNVLAEQLNQPVDLKVANDALNLVYIWSLVNQHESEVDFNLLKVIQTDYFNAEFFKAFDALDIGENKHQRRLVIQEAFKLYEMQCFAGCIPILYAQLEGILTDVLIQTGFLKQQGTKFVDVYKIVPGLKGNEIKSLWHKTKIGCELNRYFNELAAYKMDSSSTVTMTRHNILHGTDIEHFTQARTFILFIWLFAAVGFISTIKH